MSVKINENDMIYITKLHNALSKSLYEMPHNLMKNERYGAWAVTALTNMLCSILKLMGLTKDHAFNILDDIWDNQHTKYKVLN